jgi:C-terminal processing protease CtpA/Prc
LPYSSVDSYIDALTATARAQGRDRFFTYLASIREEDAFFDTGETAAFGIRLKTDLVARRVFVADAYEGAPALAAGFDRGIEILSIGASPATLRPVASILADGGEAALSEAFGPATAGVSRAFGITGASGPRELSVTKAAFDIQPVSSRFGSSVIAADGERVGYLNLRTFISPADPALRRAFADFRAQGITRFIIDYRYNGGGLVSIAELTGELLGDNRFASDVFGFTTFRPEKSINDERRTFQRQPQSVSPVRIAFIGTGDTASASELVINGMSPWLRGNIALVGANTFGKPVGQIARDRAACDDRLRVVAFKTENADRQGDYFDGLAGKVGASCQAEDDLSRQMGDPLEASTRAALDYLAGRSCAPIPAATIRSQSLDTPRERRQLLAPDRRSVVQREVPGTY